MVLDIIGLVAGIAYGYLKPRKEDNKAFLKKGLLIGGVFAILFGGLVTVAGVWMFFTGPAIAIIINVLRITVLFVIGTFIGDWLEEKSKVKTA